MNELAITGEKLDLIKRTVAKGASDDELELFLYQCKRTGLDPFTHQIYCIRRGGQMTTMTGIDGYRTIADRTGKYAGNDDPVFDSEEKPRKATVTVYKLVEGVRCPFTSTARWDQYYPGKSPLWDKMPHLMLGKCAEALALRKAFPQDLSGLYTKEEMDQGDEPVRTPSRQYALKAETDETLPKDNFVAQLSAKQDDHNVRGSEKIGPAPEYWQSSIESVDSFEGTNAKGPYTGWNIKTSEGYEAMTFKSELAEDARIMIGGGEVRILVERSKRNPAKWIYKGFEAIEPSALEKAGGEELPWQ